MQTAPEYLPNENETYMNPRQLHYFRNLLLAMRTALESKTDLFLQTLKEKKFVDTDPLDQCATMLHLRVDLSSRAMGCETIARIDRSLQRMENGEYGYCEITGEEIGIKRLLAMPVASMCLEAQEYHERSAKKLG